MDEKTALVEAVKAYARDHYETGGWDVVIECHSDAEIAGAIGKAKTVKGAIANVAKAFALRAFDSRRKDVMGEIF